MIPDKDLAELEHLISLLENTEPLSALEEYIKISLRRVNLSDPNLTRQQLEARIEATRDKALDIIFKNPDPQGFRYSIRDNLRAHVRIVSDQFTEWLVDAHFVAPGYAGRIGIILRKAKRRDLSDRFQAAYDRHFVYVHPDEISNLSISVKGLLSDGKGGENFEFEFHCLSCGGYIMSVYRPEDDDCPAICKACGQTYGRFGAVKKQALEIGDQWRKEHKR